MKGSGASEKKNHDSGEVRTAELGFEDRVRHFDRGYSNSQAVVHLLDTKASAVVGVVPVVGAFAIGLFTWMHPLDQSREAADHIGWTIPILFWLVIIWAMIKAGIGARDAVLAAFAVLVPRDTTGSLPSILFPYRSQKSLCPSTPPQDASFEGRAVYFMADADQQDVLEDYQRQLVQMSVIVESKLKDVRRAIDHLKFFFKWIGLLIGFLVIKALGSFLIVELICQ